MDELVATLQAERGRERELSEAAQAARRETQDVEGRIVSLEALQRAALGQGQGKVVDWLKSRGLERSAAPGADSCRSTRAGTAPSRPCWAATSRPSASIRIDGVAGMLDSLNAGTVTFYAGAEGPVASGHEGDTLRARVRGPAGLDALFAGIIATETLGEALRLRPQLQPGQSVITRDGIWIGPDWLRVSRDKDAHEGVLEREERLRAERVGARSAASAPPGRRERPRSAARARA